MAGAPGKEWLCQACGKDVLWACRCPQAAIQEEQDMATVSPPEPPAEDRWDEALAWQDEAVSRLMEAVFDVKTFTDSKDVIRIVLDAL